MFGERRLLVYEALLYRGSDGILGDAMPDKPVLADLETGTCAGLMVTAYDRRDGPWRVKNWCAVARSHERPPADYECMGSILGELVAHPDPRNPNGGRRLFFSINIAVARHLLYIRIEQCERLNVPPGSPQIVCGKTAVAWGVQSSGVTV